MQVKFDLQIGENKFTLIEEVKSHTEFFKKLAFYSDLPKVGPNGETDLKLMYRNPKGYEYYSIVSEKAGMELKFGQLQEPKGELFKKDWEPLYQPEQGAAPTTGGLGQAQAQAPVQGLGAPQTVPQPAQQAPAPQQAQAPVQQQTQPQNSQPPQPQVEEDANAVLSRFGIGG